MSETKHEFSLPPITTVIAVTSSTFATMIVGLSVVYEWAFFRVLGQRWITVYEITDFVSLALEWVPIAFGATLVMLFAATGIVAILNFKMSRNGRKLDSENVLTFELWLIGSLFLAVTMIWLLSPPHIYIAVPVLFAALLMFAFTACFKWIGPKRIPTRIALIATIAIQIPIALSFAMFFGATAAIGDLSSKHSPSAIVTLTSDRKIENVEILRYLNRGVLTLESKQIALYQWSEVRGVLTKRPAYSDDPRICHWFGLLCVSSFTAMGDEAK